MRLSSEWQNDRAVLFEQKDGWEAILVGAGHYLKAAWKRLSIK